MKRSKDRRMLFSKSSIEIINKSSFKKRFFQVENKNHFAPPSEFIYKAQIIVKINGILNFLNKSFKFI